MMTQRDWVEMTTSLVGGVGIGAALMYLLDPDSGQDRRQYIARRAGDAWEEAADSVHGSGEGLSQTVGDVSSRAKGMVDDLWHYGRGAKERASRATYRAGKRATQWLPVREETDWLSVTLASAGALALGAGLMYLLDPSTGRRRRAVIRDKAVHYAHEAGEAVATKSRHLRNRATGLVHEAGKMVRGQSEPGTSPMSRPTTNVTPTASSMTSDPSCPPL